MKTKLLLCFCFAVILITSGCATALTPAQVSSLDYGLAPDNYEATIKSYFEKVLVDPYSAHYNFMSPYQTYIREAPLMGGAVHAGYLVRVGVNAKNQMGGYTGEQMWGFLFNGESIIKVLEPYQMSSLRTQ